MKNSLIILILIFSYKVYAQPGAVISFNKISLTIGGLNIPTNIKSFGSNTNIIDDLDKDGASEIVVTAYDENTLSGNIFILFMNKNKTIKRVSQIGPNIGGLNGNFPYNMVGFGDNIQQIKDLNGDGIKELIVGNESGGVNNTGQFFILYLNEQGIVTNFSIISGQDLGLPSNAHLGSGLSFLGDLNGDGNIEIAARSDNKDGNSYTGIINIISVTNNGTIYKTTKIGSINGNFNGVISSGFAYCLAGGKDINKDGINDLVVSSINPKAIWILFLDSSAKVKSYQKISSDSGQYTDTIYTYETFGNSLAFAGDLDGNFVEDLFVSSTDDKINNITTGRVRLLLLNSDGTVNSVKRIDNNNGLNNTINLDDEFGIGTSGGFDLDGDFKNDILIGAVGTDDGGTDKGAIYLLSLDGAVHPTPPKALWRVNTTSGNQNTVFNFTQYSTGFPSAYKWSISPNTFTYQNGTSDTSTNPVIKFNETANYSVQLKVTNPFSTDSLLRSSYISVQKVGINNIGKNTTAISIYPNPSNGVVQIQSPVNIKAIVVFDITGKQLLQQTPHSQTDEINISHLPQGLYQIQVQTTTGVFVKKLVKE